MHVDPILPLLATIALAVLVVGFVLRLLRQPHIIGYLLVGVLLGPSGLAVVSDQPAMSQLGALGVMLLLFFVGMEVTPAQLVADWKVSVLGTLAQILVSVGCVWVLGSILSWSFGRVVMLGFVISLSSTAVVIRLLQDRRETRSRLGGHVIGILVTQDVAIVPMLIVLNLLAGGLPTGATLAKQGVGAVLVVALVMWMGGKGPRRLGIDRLVRGDRELQVFAALILCFGLAWLTGALALSAALGAFLGGMLIASAQETHWIHDSLESFRVVFVAFFFVSLGMLLDLRFARENWLLLVVLTGLVFLTNTTINTVILRTFGSSWRRSFYGGSLLAPIGELSFVLASVGERIGVVGSFAYQATIATITLSLLIGPFWVAPFRRWASGAEPAGVAT